MASLKIDVSTYKNLLEKAQIRFDNCIDDITYKNKRYDDAWLLCDVTIHNIPELSYELSQRKLKLKEDIPKAKGNILDVIHFREIKFRPILIDLNNKKVGLDYEKVAYWNPLIKSSTKER